MPVKTFITTATTPIGSKRCTAENGTDFQKPRMRSTTISTVANISVKPKKCTVCQGTNQMTLLMSNSRAGEMPAVGSVGISPALELLINKDRQNTRLDSRQQIISHSLICLKKKMKRRTT